MTAIGFAKLRRGFPCHYQGVIGLSGESNIPHVDLVVHKDAMSGWSLEILTENFRFAPEHASSEHLTGEGYAYLLDGEKIARVYGRWLHIPEPGPGTHSIRVTPNASSRTRSPPPVAR